LNNVTVAVVLHNAGSLIPHLAKTLKSLPSDVRTVIYDSGSTDGSAEDAAMACEHAEIIRGVNRGFGFGNNRCIEKITTEYTLLLNSDASIETDSISKLVRFLDDNPDHAGVQPLVRLWGWNRVTASAGVFLTGYGEAWDSRFMHLELFPLRTPVQVPAITGAVSLWRTEALRQVKGFDEAFFMYFEDADLSLRLGAAGWNLSLVRDAEASHMIGASSNRKTALEWEFESSIRIFRRYIGSGRLTWKWWQREIRILRHFILHGNSPLWRLRAVFRAYRNVEKTIDLPSRIASILFGEPLDYPLHRPDESSPGPGWAGNEIAPWGAMKTSGKPVTLLLRSIEHTVTGAVSDKNGDIITRFCVPGKATHSLKLADLSGLVYIHCDSISDRLEVKIQ